jgi:hypothetical protein
MKMATIDASGRRIRRLGAAAGIALLLAVAWAAKGVDAAGPDLLIPSVSLSPAGNVIYQVANRGAGRVPGPFIVEINVDGTRRDVITHVALPSQSAQTVESTRARLDACKAATVRLVADPPNLVPEPDERNNERSQKLERPCQ